jgi:hypothetical protein
LMVILVTTMYLFVDDSFTKESRLVGNADVWFMTYRQDQGSVHQEKSIFISVLTSALGNDLILSFIINLWDYYHFCCLQDDRFLEYLAWSRYYSFYWVLRSHYLCSCLWNSDLWILDFHLCYLVDSS